ncbi:sensor histidine kinase [Paracoccus fistulariae]|uniref:histidine kinase n=1 Tax=Paracoccus fistulariae TaxID=658446 RepID=A0ABY7SMN0_9RHOB|nr:HAMP domain-containing sensor histidine kinase [Paracoccus fistulariae]MDB6182540.1 HAMP domain-containing sensor histidine kinase [Paracoccus fistulariae]WCR07752.1 HAMP domain-containing histidine kinase [Paracoccus fistulariae]
MRSIRGRLLLLAAVWITAALLAAFLFISSLLNDFVTDRFDAETGAMADGVIASLKVNGDRIELEDRPVDPRFAMPFTGWYWQVGADGRVVARSASLLDGKLEGPTGDYTGGHGIGADGAALRVTRRQLSIPFSNARIAVTVTAPQQEIDLSLSKIRRPLAISLAVLGLGLALASLVQVLAGLNSLNRMRRNLSEVRAGTAERLTMPDVTELQPLTAEINASLDQNASLLARARQHLGNLAHSLKTPLAALSNLLPPDHDGQALIARMDRLIGWHLRRARTAGPRLLGQRSPLRPVIDDILLVLRWPIRDKEMQVQIDCPEDAAFAGERQDLEEMIGNLTENAVKWGRKALRITVTSDDQALHIVIEDDGPGMAETDRPRALIRGGRLDEHGASGSGLGLAIVADLAALHGGELRLERSDLGGLAAKLVLPA